MTRSSIDAAEILVAFQETGDPTDAITQMVANGLSDREILSNLETFAIPSIDLPAAITRERKKQSNGHANGHAYSDEPDRRPYLQPIRLDALANLPKLEPLLDGVFDRLAFSEIFGASNIGKTLLAIDVGAHVSIGREWMEHKVRQGSVVYCACEGGLGIAERIRAWFQHHVVPTTDVPFYVMPDPLNFSRPGGDADKFIEQLNGIDFADPLELIIIDTLSQALAGANENSPDAMGAFVHNVNKLRNAMKAHVLVIHHPGKDETKGARGHSLLRAALDTEMEMVRDEVSGLITATIAKQRDHETGATFHFKITSVQTGIRDDGSPKTAPVLEIETEIEAKPDRKPKAKLSGASKIALDALIDAINEAGEPAPASNHIPSDVRVVNHDLWRDYAYARGISATETNDARRKAFKRASESLIGVGHVGCWCKSVWVPR